MSVRVGAFLLISTNSLFPTNIISFSHKEIVYQDQLLRFWCLMIHGDPIMSKIWYKNCTPPKGNGGGSLKVKPAKLKVKHSFSCLFLWVLTLSINIKVCDLYCEHYVDGLNLLVGAKSSLTRPQGWPKHLNLRSVFLAYWSVGFFYSLVLISFTH